MLRRLLTAILLLPLSLNGLWMVCSEAEAAEPVPAAAQSAAPAAAPVAEAQPACKGNVMCPLHKAAAQSVAHASPTTNTEHESVLTASTQSERSGAICLLSPDGKGTSIAAIGFVYAPPAPVLAFVANDVISAVPFESSHLSYTDVQPPSNTPPPRA